MATTTTSAPARPVPPRWTTPVALGGAGVLVALGALRAAVSGEARPLVGALVFGAVIVVLVVPLHLMQRAGRGVAAPVGTAESRWSMVAFAGIQAVAAGAGAAWAAGADRPGLAIALGVWALLSLLVVVAALVGPAGSMRGRRPGGTPRSPAGTGP